jgi:hypothetical protein
MSPTLTPPYVPPIPAPPPDVRVQPPLVYVPAVWEYRHVTSEIAPDDAELNALGADGWELVSVVSLLNAVHLYFKRQVE